VTSALREKSAQDSIVLYQKNGDEIPCKINAFGSSTEDGSAACALVITQQAIPAGPQPATNNIQKQAAPCPDIPKLSKALFEIYDQEERSRPAVDLAVLIHMKAVRRAAAAVARSARSGETE
jgi:hypothetical protein